MGQSLFRWIVLTITGHVGKCKNNIEKEELINYWIRQKINLKTSNDIEETIWKLAWSQPNLKESLISTKKYHLTYGKATLKTQLPDRLIKITS